MLITMLNINLFEEQGKKLMKYFESLNYLKNKVDKKGIKYFERQREETMKFSDLCQGFELIRVALAVLKMYLLTKQATKVPYFVLVILLNEIVVTGTTPKVN